MTARLHVNTGHEDHQCGGECAWHHSDEAPTIDDYRIGSHLAEHIGTTWIDCNVMSTCQEWSVVVKALRLHGLSITALTPAAIETKEPQ